ncbi:MAG TPA: hypothetical protein VGE50_12405 [Gammaproteobacteria bacterium]
MLNMRPKSPEAFVQMVEQAIIEVDELLSCYEYDMEDVGKHLEYLEPLVQGLRRLRAAMADGSYVFANEDLSFMPLVVKHRSQLPFSELLVTINETHRNGLAVDE